MEINYWAVLVCGVLSLVVGSVWFGPMFGKKWMEICGATEMDAQKRKEMQKASMPLYGIQFVLTLFQAWVLAYFIAGWTEVSALTNALWIVTAFVIPTVAGGAMWNNDANKIKWTRFLIQGGYYLVLFILFGLILGYWK